MMRRLILIFGSIVLATIAFLGYLFWQSPNSDLGASNELHLKPTTLVASPTIAGSGGQGGEGMWIKQYDKDGNLSSYMHAKRYTPRQNGTVVDVVEPVSEFFLSGGRRLVLTGDHGVINVEQRPSAQRSSGFNSGGEAAPTSGYLYDVVIQVFEQETPDKPSMTLRTNNISFDNQTFRIATENFVDSYGQAVKADEVPVNIRGNDVDFDGRGLIARYDDLNQRIAMLQITHGDTMVIKRADLIAKQGDRKPTTQSAPTTVPAVHVASSGTPAAHVGSALADQTAPRSAKADPIKNPSASADPKKPVVVANKLPATTKQGSGIIGPTTASADKLGPTAYRATFLEDVRVTQGDQPMAEADVLAIEFFPLQGGTSTTKPATRPTTIPAIPTKKATGATASNAAPLTLSGVNGYVPPATAPSTQASTQPATVPSTQASTQPTTNPTSQPAPIIVHWKGTLRMVAIDQNTTVPLAPGEMAMTAAGQPLVLHQPQGVVTCGSMLYQSRDSAVTLKTSTTMPTVKFVDTTGQTTLITHNVDYSDATRVAILTGESSLHMVQPKQGTRPATDTIVTWKDRCTAKLFAGSGSAVDQIDLVGDVNVNHPQLKLKSRSLLMAFKADAGDAEKSDLSQIIATGDVDCDLSAPDAPNRTLRGQKVIVHTEKQPSGTLFPQVVDASGAVHATDGEQSIDAAAMQVTLAPKAKPTTNPTGMVALATSKPALEVGNVDEQTELKTFHASGAVKMISKDGTATADTVAVDQTSGKQVIELRGTPAVLTQQGRTITGPIIVAQPDDGLGRVDGPGTLHAIEEDAAKRSATPTTAPANVEATKVTDRSTTRPKKPALAPATKPAARPIDLAWKGGANFNGPGNLITFREQVVNRTTDADGTVRMSTSDEMTVTLKSAPLPPTTQPAAGVKKPAIKPAAATKPAPAEAFKDKVVSAVTLTGHVNVDSTLNDAKGDLLKRTLLQTEKLTANLDDAQQLTSIDIPVPGQALIDDRKPTTRPADSKDGGATAVEWKKSFHLDQTPTPVATLLGDVHIHHDPVAGPGDDSVDLTSSKVIITFAPEAKTTTKPVAATSTRGTQLAIGVKQVYAAAPVTFTARDMTLTAQALQYTPDNHIVLVSGTDRQPVEWFDGQKRAKGQFQQLWYNVDTQLVENMTGVTVQGGR